MMYNLSLSKLSDYFLWWLFKDLHCTWAKGDLNIFKVMSSSKFFEVFLSSLQIYVLLNGGNLLEQTVSKFCWLNLLKQCLLLLSRTELQRKEKNTAYHDLHPSIDSIQSVPKNSTGKDSLVDQAALQKISALEDELTFLRAQIAVIVSAQTLGSIPPRKPFWFEANQFSFFSFRVPVHSLPYLI